VYIYVTINITCYILLLIGNSLSESIYLDVD
jgi:hypothetical protein